MIKLGTILSGHLVAVSLADLTQPPRSDVLELEAMTGIKAVRMLIGIGKLHMI